MASCRLAYLGPWRGVGWDEMETRGDVVCRGMAWRGVSGIPALI